MKIISKAKENQIRPPSSNPLFRLRFLKSHKTNQKLWPGGLDFMPTKLKLVWAFGGLWKRALIHFSAFSNSLFFIFSPSIRLLKLPVNWKSSFTFQVKHKLFVIWAFSSLSSKVGNPENDLFQRQQIQLSLCRKGGGAGVGLLLNILHQLEPDLDYGHDADDHDNHNDDNDFSVATSNVKFLN